MSITYETRRELSAETREKLRMAATKHGGKGTRLYHVWKGIRYRCNSSGCQAFHNYGGRGIKMCKERDDFSAFREWAYNNGYEDSLSIDRIDVNKGYSPDNCRWITLGEQAQNTRKTVWVEYDGARYCLRELSRLCGIDYHALYWRIVTQGWPVEKAVSTPSRKHHREIAV